MQFIPPMTPPQLPGSVFRTFLQNLLLKNRGADRNLPPPGVSSHSVLVSLFTVILHFLSEGFAMGDISVWMKGCGTNAGLDVGFLHRGGQQSFPLGLFLKNDPHRVDISRLGGSFSHLAKSHPVHDDQEELIQWEEGCMDEEEIRVTHSTRQKPCCCSSSDVDFSRISKKPIRYTARGSQVHCSSIPERSAHVATECSNGNLNDEITDKPSTSGQSESEFGYLPVQQMRIIPTGSNLSSATLKEEELLDAMLLLYHLGPAPNFKQASSYIFHQSQSMSLLEETDKQIRERACGEQLKRLKEARSVYREEVMDCVRNCAWYRISLFSQLKQRGMYAACMWIVQFLLVVSKLDSVFLYIPEFYLETLVDCFHVLRKSDPPFVPAAIFIKQGLASFVTFVVTHFNDTRISSADLRDLLLQSISVLVQYKEFLVAFENNEAAIQRMPKALLSAFDNRSWIPVTNILLRLCKGYGFGSSKHGESSSSSFVFQRLLREACVHDEELFSAFLNRLFNTLSWAMTEFSISIREMQDKYKDLITGKTIGSGRKENGLYVLDLGVDSSKHHQQAHLTSLSDSSTEKILLWHHRLGHPSFYLLQYLFPSLLSNKNVSTLKCESCELGKHHRASFYPSINKSIIPFTLIHTDVWGPSRVASLKGHRWFVSFVDDCSRTTWVYLMKDKSEVHAIFKVFHKMICTQYGALVKVVRSDNGGEYFKGDLTTHFLDHGIIHQSSCTNTPQQNGVAERKNRHLLEMARTMCFLMQVPKSFWGEAVLTAAYLINRLPTRVLNKRAPVEVLSGSSTLFSIPPRVFGCTGFVHNHSPSREKLDPRAIKCVFVGYSPTQKGYKCYHPPSRKWFVSMDVTFFEHQSYFQSPSPLQGESTNTGMEVVPEPKMSMFNLPVSNSFEILGTLETNDEQKETLVEPMGDEVEKENQNKAKDILYQRRTWRPRDKTILPDPPLQSHSLDKGSGTSIFSSSPESISEYDDLDEPIATRKGVRSCTQHPISKFVSYSRLSPSHNVFVSKIASVFVPNNVQEALTDPKWKHAMLEEMKALHKNNTWEVVEIPKGHKTVGCKWVFTVKHKADGSIERYKARLVAKGYTQTYGIDYQETFAPVAKMNTVRVLLSLAANQNWQLHQFDVKNAFLHGNLEEEVYMSIPPGFEDPKIVGKVCKLKKSLYGLKQSPRAWFERFTQAMLKYGFKQSQGDHTLFIRHSSHGKLTALIVYVDDIVLTGDDVEEMQLLKEYLAREFEIKDLGNLKYFLGIEVARSSQGIFISQRKYVLDLLTETGMLGSKACDTPMEPNKKLGDDTDGEMVDRGRYQRLVGKLIYLSHTRPDIAFAVSVVSQFMHAPHTTHYDAVIRILRYLKSAPGKGLFFGRHDHIQVEAYTDADWAGSVSDRKSTSGYCVMVGGNLVTWRSKKQAVVSRSSAEAEFRAMSQGICELLWIKILLRDLKLGTPETMRLYCDNKAAISIAHNPVQHDRTKHVEIDRHFIKEKLNSGVICTPFVKTNEQLADIFTKGLGSRPHHFILSKLGMRDIFAPA
ncbi:retrovirus-related Pol polyprotein from transposon TNT 1-94 isoform X3 [Actinidia eriantha]|nr:retrovirus-related Pol polyprotein from transposon TNT 1-94 isoform X3 [Actinidia eriantha]